VNWRGRAVRRTENQHWVNINQERAVNSKTLAVTAWTGTESFDCRSGEGGGTRENASSSSGVRILGHLSPAYMHSHHGSAHHDHSPWPGEREMWVRQRGGTGSEDDRRGIQSENRTRAAPLGLRPVATPWETSNSEHQIAYQPSLTLPSSLRTCSDACAGKTG